MERFGVAVVFGLGVAVLRGVAVAAAALTALELFSFAIVDLPAMPSTSRLLRSWNARSAFSVASPKSPSTLPV